MSKYVKPGELYRIFTIRLALPASQSAPDIINQLQNFLSPAMGEGSLGDYKLGPWDNAPIHRAPRGPYEEMDIFAPENSIAKRVDSIVVTDLVEAERLDELVHDLKSREASDINNSGLTEQVKFLRESGTHDVSILEALEKREEP